MEPKRAAESTKLRGSHFIHGHIPVRRTS